MSDASPLRGSSSRICRVIVLVGLVCIFVFVGFSHHSESHSTFTQYDRRSDDYLVQREDNSTITNTITTSAPLSSTALSSSSVSTPSESPGPSTSSINSASHSSIPLSQRSSSVSLPPSSTSIPSSTSQSSRSAQSSASATPSVLKLAFATGTSSSPLVTSSQVPATTLAFTDYGAPTAITSIISTSSSGDPGPSNVSSALNSSSFWQKKGAVAATFTILSFVVVAISAILLVTFLKRRNARRQQQIHEELFEKFSEDGHRSNSPGPSINAAPLDAFARRDVRLDTGATYESYLVAPTPRTLPPSSPVQHPDYYNQPPSRYLAPSQQAHALARKAVPTSFRDPVSRQQERDSYQPSIDSFYGGSGQLPK